MKFILKKIEIFEDKIVLRPQIGFNYIGIVFLILCLVILSPFILDDISQNEFSFTLSYCLALAIFFIIIFYIGNRKIIFDNQKKAVYVKHFFRKRLLMPFSEILSVRPIGGSTFYYGIQRKSDPYGAHIRLTMGKEYILFKEEALPRINSFLNIPSEEVKKEDAIVVDNATVEPLSVNIIGDYLFFRKDGAIYRHKAGEPMSLWIKIIFIIAGVSCFILNFVGIRIWGLPLLGYLGIPLTVLGVGFMFTGEDYFDTDKKAFIQNPTIGKQKVFPFSDFKTFSVVRESTYGIHTGQNVNIIFKNSKGEEINILLCKGIRKSDIDRLIEETLSIMKK